MLTLESFEEASEIVKKVTQETKLIKSSYFSASHRKQSISETRKHAAYRCIQSTWGILQDQYPDR